MFTRNRGSKVFRKRRSNGRFARATVENTFGQKVLVCPHCRTITTIGMVDSGPFVDWEKPPESCKSCGKKVETWE